MAKKSVAASTTIITVGGQKPANLKRLAGSIDDRFNVNLANSVVGSEWYPEGETRDTRQAAAVAALVAFKPQDEIEAMIAAQALAMHFSSMECSRRCMIADQPYEIANGLRRAATEASRAFIQLLDALDRKRGKTSQQKVTVEHVHVHAGGQAIVGSFKQESTRPEGGRAIAEAEGEPCAAPARLAHDATTGTVLPSMRSKDQKQEVLPLTRDDERPLPHARRR